MSGFNGSLLWKQLTRNLGSQWLVHLELATQERAFELKARFQRQSEAKSFLPRCTFGPL